MGKGYAMKKGIQLTVFGISSRETKTTDTYTLNGFTAAYNELINDDFNATNFSWKICIMLLKLS